MKVRPPKNAQRFLRWFCSQEFLEEVEWDLEELFKENCEQHGYKKARKRYWADVLKHARPFFIKNRLIKFSTQNTTPMWSNYLKISLRHFRKSKLNYLISTLGLAVGISCTLLVYLFVQHETSFDGFHENKDQLFRVTRVFYEEDGSMDGRGSMSPPALGAAIEKEFPEVEFQSRFVRQSNLVLKYPAGFSSETVALVDRDFLSMFSFKVLSGNPETALSESHSMAITQKMAKRLFGDKNPIGETIQLMAGDGKRDFIISAVVEDTPNNSSFQFECIINIRNLPFVYDMEGVLDVRTGNWLHTFVKLLPDQSVAEIERKFDSFNSNFSAKHFQSLRSAGTWQSENNPYSFALQPIEDVHLNTLIQGSKRLRSARTLLLIAVVILFIATFNYVNISIAIATRRYQEIGVRKVLGALKKQLTIQFWTESVLVVSCALVLSIAITSFTLPFFGSLTESELNLSTLITLPNILKILLFGLIVGLLAGTYPALMLSRIPSIEAIKGRIRAGHGIILTKGLIIAQFSIAVTLIVLTPIFKDQLDYILNRDLGYEAEGIIRINGGSQTANLLKNELGKSADVLGITATSVNLGFGQYPNTGGTVNVHHCSVDESFFKTLGMDIIKGRGFHQNGSESAKSVIVNQKFLDSYGVQFPLERDAGRMIAETNGVPQIGHYATFKDIKVIGVVNNLHAGPVNREILPTIYFLDEVRPMRYVLVKINSKRISSAMDDLEEAWNIISPDRPFVYQFQDDALAQLYSHEKRWSSIINFATIIAVVITCMGLFGVSLILINRKIKEIGIRKVLGAAVWQVLATNLKGTISMVLLANVVAWPLAYYIASGYLQDYPFKISLNIDYFLIAALFSIIIACVTVIYNVSKASLTNPVDILRHD